MPDDDRFRSGLTWRWRRVRRSLAEGGSLDLTADLLVGALAADLRRSCGVGDLGDLAQAAARNARVRPSEAIVESEDMSNRHQLTLAIASVLSGELAMSSPPQAMEALVKRAVSDLVRDRIARMLTSLVGPGKFTAAELIKRTEELLGHEQVAKICKRLVKNPRATKLRAPNRITKRASRPDLLDAELDSL